MAFTLPVTAQYRVTCRTPECENEGIPLIVTALVGAKFVYCGPCNQRITDTSAA